MNSEILIPVGIVALVAAAIVIYLIRQSQKLKLSEVSHQEKLLAREAEVESLQQRAQQLEADNSALKHDYQLVREEKASLTTSLDLEKKQFQEKLKKKILH